MILLGLLAALLYTSVGVVGQCDPMEGEGLTWTQESQDEARARLAAACTSHLVNASPVVCAWVDVSFDRESGYAGGGPGVWHKRGSGDVGLGPLALSLKWNRHRWPGEDEHPAFCQPEVSVIVALSIAHTAWHKYGARTPIELQSIFGGHWKCVHVEGKRGKVCRPTKTKNSHLCRGLKRRGFDCEERLNESDLGRHVPVGERRELARQLQQSFDENNP